MKQDATDEPRPSSDSEALDALPVFDPAALERVTGGDQGLMRDVVEAYFEAIPDLARDVAEALGSRALDRAARSAHSIKGAAANLGAERLRCVAAAIEAAAAAADFARCAAWAGRIDDELDRLAEALSAFPVA